MNNATSLENYAFITKKKTQPEQPAKKPTKIYTVIEYQGNKLYCNPDSTITKSITNLIEPTNESLRRYGQAQIKSEQIIVTVSIKPKRRTPAEILAAVKRKIAEDKARKK